MQDASGHRVSWQRHVSLLCLITLPVACHAQTSSPASTTASLRTAPIKPVALPPPKPPPRVVSMALGTGHTCVLLSTGAVRCWGDGTRGALGYASALKLGDDEGALAAGDVPVGSAVSGIVAGGAHTCVIVQAGGVRCWGPWYELGFARPAGSAGKLDNSFFGPTDMDVGAPVIQLATGTAHTCALTANGAVRCWGRNNEGQLGYGAEVPSDAGVTARALGDVPLGGRARSIWAGEQGSCALLEDGRLSCWGTPWVRYGRSVQRIKEQAIPTVIDVGGTPKQVAIGNSHACALLENGSIRCWGDDPAAMGYGNRNEIGDDEAPSAGGPVNVGGKAAALAAGSFHTCALLDTGAVRCWGNSEAGKLGHGNRVDIGDDEVPAAAGDVPMGGKVAQIAASGWHTCALLASAALRCWGDGTQGALGYGNVDSIGDDETPEAAGDVPLFSVPMPRTVNRPTRANKDTDTPINWDGPATAASTVACEKACKGCQTLFDSAKPLTPQSSSLTARERASVAEAYAQYINSEECQADERHLDPLAIGSAQDQGGISQVISGAFTEAGLKQKLVLLLAGHCGELGSHSENWGQRLLILLEGERVLSIDVDEDTSTIAAIDLDKDGRNEILTWGGWAGAGGSNSWLGVLSLADGVETKLASSFQVDSDTCSAINPDGESKASKILYRADPKTATICFQQRTKTASCPKAR